MEALVEQQALARLAKRGYPPHHHGPMNAGPVSRRIRRVDLSRKFADKDTILRHQLVFEIGLVGDDVAGAWIDKHDRTIERQAPRLAGVTIRSLLELPKILCSQFGVDSRLRCRTRNKYEQDQANSAREINKCFHQPVLKSAIRCLR